jgi:arylsulfatase A-like enzyme
MGADHGASWVPGEHSRALGRGNVPDLMWVPKFVKLPGQRRGRVDDRNWEQVDLLPTIADLVGIQVPWKTEGASQTGEPTRTPGREVVVRHPRAPPGPRRARQLAGRARR